MAQFQGLTIVVPREITTGERRVAVTPETVREFVREGARILIETGAGAGVFVPDHMYQAEGAEVVSDALDLYNEADIVLKVKEPVFNQQLAIHEVDLLPRNSVLICMFDPFHPVNRQTVEALAARHVTSFTFDGIPRIPKAQPMDALTSMSSITGYKAVIIAANHLCRLLPTIPGSFAPIRPANVLVVGTGVAGLQAVSTARRLGASVSYLDIRAEANEQAGSLGAEIVPFDVPPELAVAEGGYAKRLPEKWLQKERGVLEPRVADCDIVIPTARVVRDAPPMLITESMVAKMGKGSVIVDVGGNCEITRPGYEYSYDGVMISGLGNIPGTVPIDASIRYGSHIWNFLCHIVVGGKIDPGCFNDPIVKGALVTTAERILDE